MQLENSREGGRPRALRGWALATWGLLGLGSLAACGTLKTDVCTPVRTRVLEELSSSDETARYVLDPWACEQNARTLHALAEELHGLEIRDGSLRAAVEAYRVEVDHLAEDYGRLAAAYQNHASLPPEQAERLRSALSQRVESHAASLNRLRLQVQSICNSL